LGRCGWFSFLRWLVGVVVVVKRLGRLKEEESLSLRDRSWPWVTSGMSPADLDGRARSAIKDGPSGRKRKTYRRFATMSRETWRRAGGSSRKMAETGATLPDRKTRLRPFGYAPSAPSARSSVRLTGRVSAIKRRSRRVPSEVIYSRQVHRREASASRVPTCGIARAMPVRRLDDVQQLAVVQAVLARQRRLRAVRGVLPQAGLAGQTAALVVLAMSRQLAELSRGVRSSAQAPADVCRPRATVGERAR
jgi:hypothetical protein